jgi:nucleotidyltransferase/DNA polymerase involved in DNA repair
VSETVRTQLLNKQQQQSEGTPDSTPKAQFRGHLYLPSTTSYETAVSACDCGCAARLAAASRIAAELRAAIKAQLRLTCCAGASTSKMLAKLAGTVRR